MEKLNELQNQELHMQMARAGLVDSGTPGMNMGGSAGSGMMVVAGSQGN